jgi:Protein of unknown function (DUF1553)/Protein of unknown function (DUF1549)
MTKHLLVLALLPLLTLRADAAPKSLSVFPPKVELHGPRAEQQLGVLGEQELTRSARYTSDNPKVATVSGDGVVRPVGDGETSITIEADGQKVRVPVLVMDATKEVLVNFSREVTPVLTKTGCNSGACHGVQHGRGGFKLSLLGFEPENDYPQIVQSAEGRRIVPSDPERSILLLKPTLALEHAGGERFKHNSPEYTIIKRWLEDGAPAPGRADPSVKSIEVWPAHRLMTPGEQQQVLVRAAWSDGQVTDITRVAMYDALNDSVAAISPAGVVTAKGPGETHVMIRFLGQAAVVQITLPYAKNDRPIAFAPVNVIDEKLKAKWQELGLVPSEQCTDEEFFRRIHLDAIGTLPDPKDIKEFLADRSLEKRSKAIDKVLDRPEFVDFWAYKWGDLLRINREAIQDKGMWSFHNWVRAGLRDRKPIDAMVREIITAEGSTFTEGPANYFTLSSGANNQAETTAQLFLGIRMQCAQCHHHPFEKWTQDDYYGLSAFFARLGTKGSQEFGLFGRETVIYLKDTGDVRHPRKGIVMKPRALDSPEMDDPFDRRRKLADWLTAAENPYFARNLANRFWAYLMGRGLVEPIDDMRSTNPPSNPELLDALAAEMVKNKYDLRAFLKVILSSHAYQLSSRAVDGNRTDAMNRFHARFTIKRLTAEQMADALDFATGTREKYVGLPLGTRAIQLPDTRVRSFLMDTFGRPPRRITCECERTTQPNIAQALHLLNGDFLNRKLAAPAGRLELLLKELFLVTLSRPPKASEIETLQKSIAGAPSLREGLQDLLWALLNARNFQMIQ